MGKLDKQIHLRQTTWERLKQVAVIYGMPFTSPNKIIVCILDDLDRMQSEQQ